MNLPANRLFTVLERVRLGRARVHPCRKRRPINGALAPGTKSWLPANLTASAISMARRLAEETGSALIETAVVLWLLGVPLFLGTIYSSVLLCNYIDITNAAHAGAIYAMRSSTFADDNAGITAAARADASHVGTNLEVTSSVSYTCSDPQAGQQYAAPAAADPP